jgi:hypothetical protein
MGVGVGGRLVEVGVAVAGRGVSVGGSTVGLGKLVIVASWVAAGGLPGRRESMVMIPAPKISTSMPRATSTQIRGLAPDGLEDGSLCILFSFQFTQQKRALRPLL